MVQQIQSQAQFGKFSTMSQSNGLVAVYRWEVADEHKSAFRERWKKATHDLRDLGGLGSVLGEDRDGNL